MAGLIEIALWYLWLCCLCSGLLGSLVLWEIRADRASRTRPAEPQPSAGTATPEFVKG